jgi:hydroxypyruvate reductase
MKPDLLMLSPLIPHAMKQFEAAYTVHRYWEAQDKDALIASLRERITAVATSSGIRGEVIRKLPKLKLVASLGVGYDSVDVKSALECGVIVTNTPDVLTECVADTCWALILATVRRTVFHDRYVRARKWLAAPAPLTDRLWGSPLGILGLGRIGKAIARRGEAFKMPIAYSGRHPQADVAYQYYPTAVELARNSRILVVVTPGGKATEKIVGKDVIDALGPSGYLINISRGTTVDEACLIDALANQRLAGAGLDVFVEEPKVPEALFALDNVVLQPHVGSATVPTRQAMAQLVVDNIAAHFAGKPPLSAIPETPYRA